MNRPAARNTQGRISPRLLWGIAVLALLPVILWSAEPGWWSGVKNNNAANDYAAVNQGQVKNIAVKAVAELDRNLSEFGGAGAALGQLAGVLTGTTARTNDYAAVNLGQLKAVAKPFYDRLYEMGYHGLPLQEGQKYPWDGKEASANDYAMANIGQVKNLFSFDLTVTGTNGLPDWWQNSYFGGIVPDPSALAPSGVLLDGSPVTILQAYENHLNPVDFYNGVLPTLSITSGGDQTGDPGTVSSIPLSVSVNNGVQNAPVTFTVTSGGALVSGANNDPAPSATVQSRTDSAGAKVYLYFPNTPGDISVIQATAISGTSLISISTTAVTSDGEGSGGGGGGSGTSIPTPPVVSYPAIDVSGGEQMPITQISLGDDNKGAFIATESDAYPIVTYHVFTFDGGNTQAGQVFDDSGMWINGENGAYNELWLGASLFVLPSGDVVASDVLACYNWCNLWCIDGESQVVTNALIDLVNLYATIGCRVSNGVNSYVPFPETVAYAEKNPTIDFYCYMFGGGIFGVNHVGDFVVEKFLYPGDGDEGGLFADETTETPAYYLCKSSGDTTRLPDGFIPFYGCPGLISDGCSIIGSATADGPSNMIWTEGQLTTTGDNDTLIGINNQNQAIGYSTSVDNGFIWQNGSHTALTSLIPPDYQAQVTNISPRMLSNADPSGIVHILCDATFTDPNDGTASQRTYVLSGPATSLSSDTWTLQEVQLPDGMSTADIRCINANGVIAGIGSMGGGTSGAAPQTMMASGMMQAAASSSSSTQQAPFLGWPLEIKDVRNWSDANDDVIVQQMPRVSQGTTPSNDYWKAATEKNIAWIVAHRNDGTAEADNPLMPQLEVGFPSAPSGLNVKWKFKCWYDRGNDVRKSRNQTEDTVIIDKTSSPIPANQPWKLEGLTEWNGDFFGGKCELTYQIVGSDGSNLTPETTVRFVIGGKNPDNAKAKTYIQGCPDAGQTGNLWFAYAIAKSETAEHRYQGSFYNQFRPNPAKNQLGFPTWNDDGPTTPGGYGIFQVTGSVSDEKANIPRKQIWNWQEDVKGGLDLLRSKRTTAVAWMNQQRNSQNANGTALPSHTVGSVTFAEGTNRKMEDAVTMKLYNGASRAPTGFVDNGSVPGFLLDPQGSDHYCFWKNAAHAWALNRYNNPPEGIAPFNYVSRVCTEVEP
jgi:hypothetical protein